MDKYIYNNSNGLWYELQGDYYIPCLTLPEEECKPIGICGQRHKSYLKEYRKASHTTMLTYSTVCLLTLSVLSFSFYPVKPHDFYSTHLI